MSARLLEGTDFFESQAEDLALKWGTSKVFETQLKKKKTKIWASGPSLYGIQKGEKWKK